MAEKEYIERDSIYSRVKTHTNPYGKPTLDYESGVKVLYMIEREPAADVVEVVHARWEKTHDDPRVNKYRCTNCKAEKMRDNYCPNCGAKMDGATDNNVGDKGR